jgi:hypothetical protein
MAVVDTLNPGIGGVPLDQAARGPRSDLALLWDAVSSSKIPGLVAGPVIAFLILYALAWSMRNDVGGLNTRKDRALFALKGLAALFALALAGWLTGIWHPT